MASTLPTTEPAAAPGPPPAPPVPKSELRPEIQALRALAVALVVICHFWRPILPGGFIGVDVFFVISGYLITSHLLRETDRTGSLSLPRFWARRARRLLPAALFTLLLCAIATVAFVPQSHWAQFLTEIRASTLYVQNWQLAHSATDYFAQANVASPVQHFWSLSAEEQFYLVWPILILLTLALIHSRRAIIVVLSLVTAGSLAYSIAHTASDPAAAYFITPTRAWEFGMGGLLAVVPGVAAPGRPGLRTAVGWLGFAAIIVSAATLSGSSSVPGAIALVPVAGALALIWAGSPAHAAAPTRPMAARPVQRVGDLSYSIYLVHWPLLIFAPFVLDVAIGTPVKLGLVALTVLAAWLMTRLIENPIRFGSLTGRRPRWTFAAAVAGMVLVVGFVGAELRHLDDTVAAAQRRADAILASHPRCFGAAARDPLHPCTNPKLATTVIPTPVDARDRKNAPCAVVQKQPFTVCGFGVPAARARRTFVLIGDSHASHWRAALQHVALANRWRGLSVTHTSCYFTAAVEILTEPFRSQCLAWKREVRAWFTRHPEVSVLFTAGVTGGRGVEGASKRGMFAAETAGFVRSWAMLPRTVRHVIVIRDNPKIRDRTFTCIEAAMSAGRPAGTRCAEPRATALSPDAQVAAAAQVGAPRAQVADLTHFFCGSTRCYPVVGGALVYKDTTHLTSVYATTLGPYVTRAVNRLARAWPEGADGAKPGR